MKDDHGFIDCRGDRPPPLKLLTKCFSFFCSCSVLSVWSWRLRSRVGVDQNDSETSRVFKNGELNPLNSCQNVMSHSRSRPRPCKGILKIKTQNGSITNIVKRENSDTTITRVSQIDIDSGSDLPSTSVLSKMSKSSATGVSFSNVDVRTYEMCPSDNPSVPFGPALGIGWEYEVESRVSVDEFENTMKCPALGKKQKHEMKTTLADRLSILRRAGWDDDAIKSSAVRCSQARTLREKTTKEYQLAAAEGRVDDYEEQSYNNNKVSSLLDHISALCSVSELP